MSDSRRAAATWLAAAVLLLVVGLVVAARGNEALTSSEPNRVMLLLATLVFEGGYVLAWLAASAGYGFALMRGVLGDGVNHGSDARSPRRPEDRPSWGFGGGGFVQIAMGSAGLMFIAWVGGWMGWLGAASGWAVLIAGWVLWGVQLGRVWGGASGGPHEGRTDPHEGRRTDHRGALAWPWVVAMPAVALLVAAATIAPGILWRPTEFGAYDVLSYHLQLPNEWLAAGRIAGFEHNVYSYLPNGFEAVYFHLAVLRGDAVAAAEACQLLHAAMAIIAAGAIATLVRRVGESAGIDAKAANISGAAAGAIYLAVPWVIVTGSLAYNEQAMAAMGAAALAIALDPPDRPPWRRGLAAGLLVGGAMLCKLTAVGLFALPIGIVLLTRRGRWTAAATFIVGLGIPVGLFMLRNAMWTGNPVFPLMTDWFGTAHWTNELAARWNAAHSPALPWSQRFGRIGEMLLGHFQYGYVLWPAAMVALVIGIVRQRTRRTALLLLAMILVQLIFWLSATHLQSRFMVAAIVPAAAAIGLGLALVNRAALRSIAVIVPVAVLTGLSFMLYMRQGERTPARYIGAAKLLRDNPYKPTNHLPGHAKIYAEGDATPLYMNPPITYHTVWDASMLGQLIDEHGPAGAIAELRRLGYTHLLIDRTMLSIWWSEGNYGYDRSMTPARIADIEKMGLPTVDDQPGVRVLYELPPSRE